jgi:hypothetical protein
MASFTSFFPRNVATSCIFLQTKSVGLLSAPLRHKFVTKTNPWLGSIFLVRNFTKIQKNKNKKGTFVSIFSFFSLKKLAQFWESKLKISLHVEVRNFFSNFVKSINQQ